MDLLKVDYDKCIKCGICVEACPSCILSMGELGPECNFDRGCMSCGHCVAICPTAAMDNKYVPLEEQLPLPMPVLDAETAYNFLRMRRSVRMFKPELLLRLQHSGWNRKLQKEVLTADILLLY